MRQSFTRRVLPLATLVWVLASFAIACGGDQPAPTVSPDVVPDSALYGSWNHEDTFGISRYTFDKDHSLTAHFVGQSFNGAPMNTTLQGTWTPSSDGRFSVSIDNCRAEPCSYIYWFQGRDLYYSLADGSAQSTLVRASDQGATCQPGFTASAGSSPAGCTDPNTPSTSGCAALQEGDDDLTGCDLSGLDLSYTDFSANNLTNVDMRGTDWTGANLHRANLTNADLTDAELTDANLDEVRWDNTICPDGSNTGAFPGTPCGP